MTQGHVRKILRLAGLRVRILAPCRGSSCERTVAEGLNVVWHQMRDIRPTCRFVVDDPNALHIVLCVRGCPQWAWHLPTRARRVTLRPCVGQAPPTREQLQRHGQKIERARQRQQARSVVIPPTVTTGRTRGVKVVGEGG